MNVPAVSLSVLLCGGVACEAGAEPVVTRGGATWASEATATGMRTVFTVTDDSVLSWSNFQLPQGSEMIFDFAGGDMVVNFLTGSGVHRLAGSVTGNGHVAFISPNAHLQVTGSISAASVTLSTLGVDAADLLDGGAAGFSGNARMSLAIAGLVEATGGDATLVSGQISVGPGGRVVASDAVVLAAGSSVDSSGVRGERFEVSGTRGEVLNNGLIRGDQVRVTAVRDLTHQGRIEGSAKKVFLEVGVHGAITLDGEILMIEDAVIKGARQTPIPVRPVEGDAAPVLNDAVLQLPALKRPDGTQVAAARPVSFTAPVSASGEASREAGGRAAARSRGVMASLIQRQSFFGVRGGGARPEAGR